MQSSQLKPAADTSGQDVGGQYSVGRILAIWAAAALPMGTILWVVMPVLRPHLGIHPGLVYYPLITGGLVWQGVLCLLILRREVRPFTWAGVKRRLWLNRPVRPASGKPSGRLLLWTIPAIAFLYAWTSFGPLEPLNNALLRVFPFLSAPYYAVMENCADAVKGQWWLLGVVVVSALFNYLLGEELLFRGILLPKMKGAFGRWDWLANGVLFGAYHIHVIWAMPSQIIVEDWVYPWIAKRYRSYWMAAIVHGFDAVFLVVLFPLAIMGKL